MKLDIVGSRLPLLATCAALMLAGSACSSPVTSGPQAEIDGTLTGLPNPSNYDCSVDVSSSDAAIINTGAGRVHGGHWGLALYPGASYDFSATCNASSGTPDAPSYIGTTKSVLVPSDTPTVRVKITVSKSGPGSS